MRRTRASNKNWNFYRALRRTQGRKNLLPSVRIWTEERIDRYLRHHNYNADKNPFTVASISFVPKCKISIDRFNQGKLFSSLCAISTQSSQVKQNILFIHTNSMENRILQFINHNFLKELID